MFRKTPTSPLTPQAPIERVTSVLGPGINWKGDLRGSGGVRIEGSFEGEINIRGLVVIGETGQLHAEVFVGSIIISGIFQGTIRAKASVQLKAPAKIKGEIICPRVSIEDGVVFDGLIQMSRQAQSSESPSVPRSLETKRKTVALVEKNPEPFDEQDSQRTAGTLL